MTVGIQYFLMHILMTDGDIFILSAAAVSTSIRGVIPFSHPVCRDDLYYRYSSVFCFIAVWRDILMGIDGRSLTCSISRVRYSVFV